MPQMIKTRISVRPLLSMLHMLAIVISLFLYGCGSGISELTLITDEGIDRPGAHGLRKLEAALAQRGIVVHNITGSKEEARGMALLIGTTGENGPARQALEAIGVALPDKAEALVVKKDGDRIIVCGADNTGLMYALLDIAQRVELSQSTEDIWHLIPETVEEPTIKERSVSIYTMQRAWFEQRLFDEDYLTSYFDQLAQSRFNSFVVIFGYENGGFMAPPYPYFFNTVGFPEVTLTGLSPEEQKKNRDAFNRLIEIAHDRGIRVTAGIWDHIYRGGVQSGGLTSRRDAPSEPQEHMVWGVTSENLYDYTKASLRQFLQVFPAIDGIQFRMHNESGLKREEMGGFWHEIFEMITTDRPGLAVDLRAKELPDEIIDDAVHQGLNFRVATKYWMEQMGMPFHPTHVNRQNQHDRRHGYADLLKYPQKYQVHWRLWNGGTSRILLWGDPTYVRRFVESTQLYNGNSFEVNEPLATKMETQPQDKAPFALLNEPYRYYEHEFERYWYFFELFGRIGYNPQIPDDHWDTSFTKHFGREAGPVVQEGLMLASQVLPRIVAASYPYQFFPTTRGWAEKMHMRDLRFFAQSEGSDIAQFVEFRRGSRAHDQRNFRCTSFGLRDQSVV